jgi:hypothetical protein
MTCWKQGQRDPLKLVKQSDKDKTSPDFKEFWKAMGVPERFDEVKFFFFVPEIFPKLHRSVKREKNDRNFFFCFRSFSFNFNFSQDNLFDDAFKGVEIQWFLSAHLTTEEMRKHIGNVQCIVIFKVWRGEGEEREEQEERERKRGGERNERKERNKRK